MVQKADTTPPHYSHACPPRIATTPSVTRRMRALSILISLGASLALCGCDTSDRHANPLPSISSATITPSTAPDVEVVVSDPTAGGMAALLSGRLAVVDGCLGVRDSVVIWPPGTVVIDGQPLRIEIPGVGEVGVDESIELGGGYVEEGSEAADGPLRLGTIEVPAKCRQNSVFLAAPTE